MADIDQDQMDQFFQKPIAKGSEFFDEMYDASISMIDLLRMCPITKSKTADTTRVSTTTIAMDPTLYMHAPANSRYRVKIQFSVLGESTNGDLDFTLLGPTGSSGWFRVDGATTKSAAGPAGTHAEITQATDTTAVVRTLEGVIVLGSTAGDIGLGWAQNASHADDVIIQAGSFISFMQTMES